ncbi:MAG: helix-turn-helix domain-containing protein [Patescibacteria group bacterium]|nr:helix-turn-helix domain-containing protein [Patescibacteria group bacterium]
MENTSTQFLNSFKAAEMLCMSVPTFRRWVKKKKIIPVNDGQIHLFALEEIERVKQSYHREQWINLYKPIDENRLKKCPRCQQEKPIKDFSQRTGMGTCRKCTLAKQTEKTKRLKKQAVEYKGGKCCVCGYNRCFRALDFHHTNGEEKEFSIGQRQGNSFESIKAELDKCILVCKNCHAELHDGLIDIGTISKR